MCDSFPLSNLCRAQRGHRFVGFVCPAVRFLLSVQKFGSFIAKCTDTYWIFDVDRQCRNTRKGKIPQNSILSTKSYESFRVGYQMNGRYKEPDECSFSVSVHCGAPSKSRSGSQCLHIKNSKKFQIDS